MSVPRFKRKPSGLEYIDNLLSPTRNNESMFKTFC